MEVTGSVRSLKMDPSYCLFLAAVPQNNFTIVPPEKTHPPSDETFIIQSRFNPAPLTVRVLLILFSMPFITVRFNGFKVSKVRDME